MLDKHGPDRPSSERCQLWTHLPRYYCIQHELTLLKGLPPNLADKANKFQEFNIARPAQDDGRTDPKNGQAALYPAKFFKKVPEEDQLHTLSNAIQQFASGENAPFLKPELPQAAVDLIQKKQRQAFELALFQWIEQNYDIKNPVNVKYVMELWPEYFEKKKELINEAIDLLRKTAYLNLMNGYIQPGDNETKEFVLSLAFGMIDVDRSILRYILPVESDWSGKTDEMVQRGLFNPLQQPQEGRSGIEGGLMNLLNGNVRSSVLGMKKSDWGNIWDNFRQEKGGQAIYQPNSVGRGGFAARNFWGSSARAPIPQ
jgi:hypothetical protein